MNSFSTINKDSTGNFWQLNPHIKHVEPFSSLYSKDKSKSKEDSSSDMWCVLWMTDPDEEANKFYRIVDKEERLQVCKDFHKKFDPEHPLIIEAMEKYPFLCMTADELAYKLQKDQLIEISLFLSRQEINLTSAKEIIELKAKMPKIYQDFEKIDKMFKTNKSEQRIFGGRKQTAREKGHIVPDE